jgi:tRNA nucleotidyltransferase (CCA-adding enzyme)
LSYFNVPTEVGRLVDELERAGFETWCVGGAVRDALLGHPHLDWDLATAATPEQVQRLFKRTIPVGIKFGTVGVLDRDGRMHEVTTFRRDIETDGRHAVVKFGASLDEDLARRDLTINAIAYSPSRDLLHDPFGGRDDLTRRLVRAVGDPPERMREDRLRALRAIRFAARLGFDIDAATWTAIVESAPYLDRLSPERVRQELEKTMEQVARPSEALARWKASGALRTLIPALDAADPDILRAVDYLPMPGLPRRPQRRINRLTALFLEVEPATLAKTLSDLRFSNNEAAWILDVVRHWQRLSEEIGDALMKPSALRAGQLRRWASRAGRTQLGPLMRIGAAVWCARRAAGSGAPDPARVRAAYHLLIRTAYRDPIEMADLAVDGADLMKAGIAPGPRLGKILRALLELVIDDPALNQRDVLLSRATELAQQSTEAKENG